MTLAPLGLAGVALGLADVTHRKPPWVAVTLAGGKRCLRSPVLSLCDHGREVSTRRTCAQAVFDDVLHRRRDEFDEHRVVDGAGLEQSEREFAVVLREDRT